VPVNMGGRPELARALRTFLRQDTTCHGREIRDLRDAEDRHPRPRSPATSCSRARLHRNDARRPSPPGRTMGIEPFLLAYDSRGVLAQRLRCAAIDAGVPKPRSTPATPCWRQRASIGPTLAGRKFYFLFFFFFFFKRDGLATPFSLFVFLLLAGPGPCHHTGYKGRLGIFEFLPMSPTRCARIWGGRGVCPWLTTQGRRRWRREWSRLARSRFGGDFGWLTPGGGKFREIP